MTATNSLLHSEDLSGAKWAKSKPVRKPSWPKSRLKELSLLRELLREAQAINHGNHCVERIKRCEKLADKLNSGSLRTGRKSFHQFLIEEAWRDQIAADAKAKPR